MSLSVRTSHTHKFTSISHLPAGLLVALSVQDRGDLVADRLFDNWYMRQLEEADNKLVIPPTWDTHQHTALDGEPSLPNCRALVSQPECASNPSAEHTDNTEDVAYELETADSGSMSSEESAAAEEYPESEEDCSHERVQTAPIPTTFSPGLPRHRFGQDLEVSRSPSPRLTHNSYDLEYDSEEDLETASTSQDKWPRIGSNYQANIDDLYGAEIGDDNATLLWDPETMTEDELSTLMGQCNVSDATYFAYQQSLLASATQGSSLRDSNHSALTCSTSSSSSAESETLSLSTSKSSTEGATTASFLPLEHMLQLIHDSNYVASETINNLKKSNTFGWSSRQSMFTVWNAMEMEAFETAMIAYPKRFEQIAAVVGTRSTPECIEFYYSWKHTERHAAWRRRIEQPLEEPLSHSHKVPSRKRKREVELTMDSSERLYLEALGSFEQPHMLNIILDAPSMLAEDLPPIATYHEEEEVEEESPRTTTEESVDVTKECAQPVSASAPAAVEFSRHLLAAVSPKRQKLAETDDITLLHAIEPPVGPTTVDPTTIFSPIFSTPENATLDFFMHF